METIFIIGAGAIGKALAAFLTLQRRNVVVLRGSLDNIKPYEEESVVVLPDNSTLSSNLTFSSLSNFEKLEGIIILTNKAFGNANLAVDLKPKAGASPVVLLQNGLNIEKPFLQDFSGIYRCVLFATSQLMSPGTLRFKPVSVSPVGIIKGNRSDLDRIIPMIDTENFRFNAVDNIHEVIWRKVIANCVFNSICPLLDIDNGVFHRDKNALTVANCVIQECITIASASGINLQEKDIADTVLMISKSSDGQLISTLQDIKHGRETEIESLNFAIAKLADEMNLPHLVPTTRALGELTRLKAKLEQGKIFSQKI